MIKPQPIPPKPGQESVWDYPRPAILEDTDKHLKVVFNNLVVAETKKAKRVLETSHPPTYYIPTENVKLEYLTQIERRTFCEWKGWCTYYDLKVGEKQANAAVWRFFEPNPNFVAIKDCYGFYPSLMDACYVNDELVTPQPGNYYGGWITKDIVGPFKGEPGTIWW